MNITESFIEYMREEGENVTIHTKWEVCWHCKGSGSSSAYLGAFTADDMYELGDEFREDYMNGHYDRACPECNGRTTVREIDRDLTDESVLKEFDSYVKADSDVRQIEAMERRMGA